MMEHQHESLPGYCLELIKEVVSTTDYPFAIIPLAQAPMDSELHFATSRSEANLLLYRLAYHEHLAHFVVSAAYKIKRMWAAPYRERMLATTQPDIRLPLEEEDELARKLGVERQAPPVPSFSKTLAIGLLRQLSTFPVDLRVEREIARDLPGHRPLQRAYLQEKVLELIPPFEHGAQEYATELVYRCGTAMNSAFVQGVSDLTGISAGRAVREHPSDTSAQKLLESVTSTPLDTGVAGDRQIVDAWARELGLIGWYRWRRMDSL